MVVVVEALELDEELVAKEAINVGGRLGGGPASFGMSCSYACSSGSNRGRINNLARVTSGDRISSTVIPGDPPVRFVRSPPISG